MPGMDGFEVCRELKRAEQTRDIPVLFLSAEMQEHQIARALDMGGADYVTKPFKSIVLQARVRVALRTKRVIDLLKKEAVVDGLTGLLSRRRFEEILMRRWSEAGTRDESVAVALLELDDFDSINDGLGHGVGDEVLIRVAKALQGSQRTDDIACRFRGETFAMLLPGVERVDAEVAVKDAVERIREMRLTVGGKRVAVTASAGLAWAQPARLTIGPGRLLGIVEAALARANSKGCGHLVAVEAEEPD